MAVPTKLSDISATAANNSPTGSESIGSSLDDYIRGYGAAIRAGIAYKGADIASASTPDLDAVAGSYHDITGTSTITGFVSASAGIRKTLQFDGIVKLIDSTQLPLVDGADLTTAAGTVIEVISEGGGVWRQVGMLASSVIPPGVVLSYGGSSAASGFLLPYGQNESRTTYAGLFAIYGTTYGVGDGSSTFGMPDCRARSIFGKDDMGGTAADRITNGVSGITGTTLGATGGSQSHTLTTAEIPAHTHTATTVPASSVVFDAGGGIEGPTSGPYNTGTLSVTLANAGGGGAHRNMPPAIIMLKIVKT